MRARLESWGAPVTALLTARATLPFARAPSVNGWGSPDTVSGFSEGASANTDSGGMASPGQETLVPAGDSSSTVHTMKVGRRGGSTHENRAEFAV